MKAIVLQDVLNNVKAVFLKARLSEPDAEAIRQAAKTCGYLIVIKEATPIITLEDFVYEVQSVEDDYNYVQEIPEKF